MSSEQGAESTRTEEEARRGEEGPPFGLGRLLAVWLGIGLQSFGGGGATLALIRRAAVDQYGWLTEAEFTRDWTLVQIAPGINLLALTILLGRRVGGIRGVVLALLGLLLPTVAIATALTAFYARIEGLAWVQAALKGILPATIGLSLLTSFQIARPLFQASRREGNASLGVSVFLLIGSALAMLLWNPPVILVLLVAAGDGALFHGLRPGAPTETDAPPS